MRHTLQPFAPEAFGSRDEPRRFSYRARWREAGQRLGEARHALAPWLLQPLPPGGLAFFQPSRCRRYCKLSLFSQSKGGFTAAEAWAWHRGYLADRLAEYDPRVGTRILRGKEQSAADYIELLAARQRWIAQVKAQLDNFDGLLMPTVPVVAPKIADLVASDDAYFAANGLMLRNPTLINFLDGCAVSLPIHRAGDAPVGLSLAGSAGQDARLLNVALAVEALFAQA